MARFSQAELDQAANLCRHRLDSALAHIAAAGNGTINHFIGLVEASKAEGKTEDILFSPDDISQSDRKRFVSLHAEARNTIELFYKTFKAFPINLPDGTRVAASLLNDDALGPYIDKDGYEPSNFEVKKGRGRPRSGSKVSVSQPAGKRSGKLIKQTTGKKRGRPRKNTVPATPEDSTRVKLRRLTADEVREIKQYLSEVKGGAGAQDDAFLAEHYGVSPSAIWQLRMGRTHKVVPAEPPPAEDAPETDADLTAYLESQGSNGHRADEK